MNTGARASATAPRHRPVDGDDAAEGGDRVGGVGARVGRRDLVGDGDAARVGVLDDDRRGTVAEAVHQLPGRLGVEEVEVGQLLAAVLDGVVPPGAGADAPVAGALLVGVLAVPEVLGPLEGEVERGRQRHGAGRVGLVEPGDDRGVVGGGVGERLAGQRPPGGSRQAALGPHLGQHRPVVAGVDDDADVGVVLGRRPHHRRAADVDQSRCPDARRTGTGWTTTR